MNKEEIQALITEALTNAGFIKQTDMNATAAIIRQLKDKIDGQQNPMDALVAAGLLEKKADGTYAPKSQAPAAQKKDGPQEQPWEAQIRQMQEQMAAKDKALEAEKAKREQSELKSAVISAFEKAGAVNAGRDYVHVLDSVKRAEDGSFHTVKKDQFGVETKVPLDAAFGEFLKSNPELAKATAKPGSGTAASTGGDTSSVSGPTSINTLAAMPTDQYFAARKAGKI